MLELSSLAKRYRSGSDEVSAVDNFSLSIKAEDYLAIVGPSGAGKSTLLHIIGGLEPPTKGVVTYRGKDIYRMKDREISLWRNKTIGFVFQFYHLIDELNVVENVALGGFLMARKSSLKTARELLKYLDIEARANFFPCQLSGGERQKVAIARALVNDPEVILCDEPTGNLDKDSQEKVVGLLMKLNRERKKTIILATHNLELAARAEKIVFIESGQISKIATNINESPKYRDNSH